MLVLSRKPGEKVTIGNAITLTVLDVTGNKVRVGIEAPDHIRILRAELGGWQHDSMGRNEHLDPDLVANPNSSELLATGLGLNASLRHPASQRCPSP